MSISTSIPVRVLVGGAVGAAAALFFASKRGEGMCAGVWKWRRDTERSAAAKIRGVGSDLADAAAKAGKRVEKTSEAAARELDRAAEQR